MRRRPPALALLALSIALGAPRASDAQSTPWQLVARIEGPDGTPLPDAQVQTASGTSRSDVQGLVRLSATRRDTLSLLVRHVGFVPTAVTLRAEHLRGDTVVVVLEPTTQALDAVRVEERDRRSPLGAAGFEERRARGIGRFVTRAELERLPSMRLSDALRGTRGVVLVRVPSGYGVRFSAYSGRQRRCIPEIWVDGARARGLELDDLAASTVIGLELYPSSATVPFQFSSGGTGTERCGTIVVWTRAPGTP